MASYRLRKKGSYGPEDLQVLSEAFNSAWGDLRPLYHDQEALAATRLAKLILTLGKYSDNPAYLKATALQVMSRRD
jgi:hypothetical protein